MTTSNSFKLTETFLEEFKKKKVEWGPLGEITFLRTYSRPILEEGRTEKWWETIRRVVEGTYNIQKNYCRNLKLPWNDHKAQCSAQEMYRLMFDMKFLPPGRGLWSMGTKYVEERTSASLYNCSFVSTANMATEDPSEPFCYMMDISMLGVGTGFDTEGAGTVKIKEPRLGEEVYVVEDTREGWVDLTRVYLDAYFGKGILPASVDYSKIRPYGAPIKTFGGTASGSAPLEQLIKDIPVILNPLIGQYITSEAIVDISNVIARCVISGNVRRCLPPGTRVYTNAGYKPIEQIAPGDLVSTPTGFKPVKALSAQGIQSIVEIIHQNGKLQCTPNHRIAVMDSLNSYIWKMACELSPGDRLFFPRNIGLGYVTMLPVWSYNKSDHSTTCKDLTIPALDSDMAWLLGLFAADGYTYPNFKDSGFNAYVSLVFGENELDIAEKAAIQLRRFGTNVTLRHRKNENSWIVHSQSKQLAWYMAWNFKQANTPIVIPDCIVQGTLKIKLAYCAGLADGDGALGNRPVIICSTVYESLAKDLQALLGTCGIESRIKEGSEDWPSRKGWQKQYHVSLNTLYAQQQFAAIPELLKKVKQNSRAIKTSTIPLEWTDIPKFKVGGSDHITADRYEYFTGKTLHWIPTQVVSINTLIEPNETYDLEIDDPIEHCFVAEGVVVHNSAAIAIGEPDDKLFLGLKDPSNKEKLEAWRWASNNTVRATIGMDYTALAEQTATNGEPGYFWLDNARCYDRMIDGSHEADMTIVGQNACGEISCASHTFCNVPEAYPARHNSLSEFKRTLKFAYLYAKTVTLLSTHIAKTNAVLLRDRQIGLSVSGIAQSIQKHGYREHIKLCDEGYKYLKHLDKVYSDWLCIPRSKKLTSVKPSGSVSLLSGSTPGVHFPYAEYYYRTIRMDASSDLVKALKTANYRIVEGEGHNTSIVYFPVHEENFWKDRSEVSIWEQLELVAQHQYYWADNQVSVTVTFKPEEAKDIARALSIYETRLKSVSFLPLEEHKYKHAPYQKISREEYEKAIKDLKPLKLKTVETEGNHQRGCDGDHCELVFPTDK